MNLPLRLLPVLALLALAGCTQNLLVTVDGYASPEAAAPAARAGKYRLASGNIRVPETDLQYRTHAATVEAALAAAGWTRAADPKDAATLIRFRWSVSEPLQDIREYDTPEYGVTGYHLTQTKETNTTGQTTTRSQMTPSYGQTGYSRRTDARVSYGMSLQLEAYDLAHPGASGEPPQLWKTLVATRDSRGDFRAILPELLKVAAPHLGTDTHGLREIEIPAPPAK